MVSRAEAIPAALFIADFIIDSINDEISCVIFLYFLDNYLAQIYKLILQTNIALQTISLQVLRESMLRTFLQFTKIYNYKQECLFRE